MAERNMAVDWGVIAQTPNDLSVMKSDLIGPLLENSTWIADDTLSKGWYDKDNELSFHQHLKKQISEDKVFLNSVLGIDANGMNRTWHSVSIDLEPYIHNTALHETKCNAVLCNHTNAYDRLLRQYHCLMIPSM